MIHVGLVLLALAAGPVGAQEEAEVYGLVVDNTITRFGHDFHRYLSARLQDTSSMDFDLVVRERPSARWGSLVWVEHNRNILYRRFLQPNVAQIEEIATQAADLVLEEINRAKLQSLLQDTFDMERDEL
nr:curli production assembly/transport protein CsgE [Stutzerimonas azotifigens]